MEHIFGARADFRARMQEILRTMAKAPPSPLRLMWEVLLSFVKPGWIMWLLLALLVLPSFIVPVLRGSPFDWAQLGFLLESVALGLGLLALLIGSGGWWHLKRRYERRIHPN